MARHVSWTKLFTFEPVNASTAQVVDVDEGIAEFQSTMWSDRYVIRTIRIGHIFFRDIPLAP